MKIDLSGKTALVTGSTRGIGNAIAARLSECGANVAVVGRDAAKAEQAAAVLQHAKGFACDVGDAAQVAALESYGVVRQAGAVPTPAAAGR